MNIAQLMDAVVDRLGAVSAVTSSLGSVPGGYQSHAIYTNAPQADESEDSAFFPYITVTQAAAGAYDTKDDNGGSVLIDVHVWSRGHSVAAPLALADAVYDALQRHDLAVTGANTVTVNFESGLLMQDPDGITMHAVRTFRVLYFLT